MVDVEQLNSALNAIKVLRSNVSHVFTSISNGLNSDFEEKEEVKQSKYIQDLQELLSSVNKNLRDVESAVANLTAPPGPFNLGNSTFLSQETTQERQGLYSQLINSYKWTDKIREYSNLAGSILSANSVSKTYKTFGTTKRRKTQTSNHNVAPDNPGKPSLVQQLLSHYKRSNNISLHPRVLAHQSLYFRPAYIKNKPHTQSEDDVSTILYKVIENLVTGIDRLFPDVTITASRPFSPNPIIQASLGRTLKAVIAFKGLMIEWVIVKAHSESNDLWTESRYQVFRKVTENCHAAMCHFHSPTMPDLAVRSFMHWFHSYISLFNAPCKRCGNYLQSSLPPTWRDLRSLEPYHEECK